MRTTVMARPSSALLAAPTIVVTAPDNQPAQPYFPIRALPGFENGLLQVPRRVSMRPTTTTTTPLRQTRQQPRPQPIPVPEPVSASVPTIEEEDDEPTEPSAPPKPVRSVLETLKGLERYCESIVINVRARPASLIEPMAPKPVASAFKKAHRRVHSVDISWNRAPPASGRPGVATNLTPRRKRSISSADEIFAGPPKAMLTRSERMTAFPRRAATMRERSHAGGLPQLIEDHQPEPVSHQAGRLVRSFSVDAALSQLLRAPQPTLLSSRSARPDWGTLVSSAAVAAVSANNALLPEGFFTPGASLAAAGYYNSLSKNAMSLRNRVFKPLKRYITI